MIHLSAYIHPVSTFLPCTGLGRHINNMVLGLYQRKEVDLNLLVARQWLDENGKIANQSPLHQIPASSFPFPERMMEHIWKTTGLPYMDRWIDSKSDWVYCPAQTYFPCRKKKTAVTIHDIEAFETHLPWSNTTHHRNFRRKWAVWIHKMIRHTDLIFTVSEFSKNRMVDLLGADSKKIKVVGNGVSPHFFNLQKNRTTPFDFPYVLSIGGLRERKGAPSLIKIAKQLEQEKSELKIVVVGQHHEPYLSQASGLKNLVVQGMLPDEELQNLLSNAFAFLFLSYYEGFGIPVLEAMASGIPVISSNAASLPEVVGEAGILVHPEASGEVTSILQSWIKNPIQRKEWIEKGSVHAADYQWSNCVDRALAFLNKTN